MGLTGTGRRHGETTDDSGRLAATKIAGWGDDHRAKKNGRTRRPFFWKPPKGSMTLHGVLGFVRGILGGTGSVLGGVSGLAGSVGSVGGGALHRVHGAGRSSGGGRRSRGGRGRGSGGGCRSRSRSSGRCRSSLLRRIGSLLSGVGRLLGVLRGILRAIAACRQQRDERGGE